MVLMKLIALLCGLICAWPASVMMFQPRASGQDYDPFSALIGALLFVPSIMLILLAFTEVH